MTRVAIIGAGIAGLVLANKLRGKADVTVFEKSRGVGGRMATRYRGDFEFDHGAQFFTARTPEFREFLGPLIDEGVVANWRARFVEFTGTEISAERQWDDSYPHYVGTPRMNAIGKFLAQGIDVETGVRVTRFEREGPDWRLYEDGDSLGAFDWVVATAPAAQTSALANDVPALAEAGSGADMLPCFALMLGFDAALDMPWQAALVKQADISWVSVNSSKPGRNAPFTLVVHSTNAWAADNFEKDADAVSAKLLDAASAVLATDLAAATVADLQRWRYANIEARDGPAYFCDAKNRVAACGDWFVRGRVEAAFTSARQLSAKLEALL